MAEFKLGRIRFVWKGDWNASTIYYKDDVVRVGGRTFICQVGHTSSPDFNTDLEYSPTKWNQLTDGESFKGDWTSSTFYQIRDVVKNGGLLYICIDSHTSANSEALGLENDQNKWQLFAESTEWKGDWSTETRYKVNDIVRYGGYTYICNTYHHSAALLTDGLELDQSKWDIYNPGIEYRGDWVGPDTRYRLNDVVKYGAGLWICTTQHSSTDSFITDQSNWNHFVKGFEFENEWVSASNYQIGDVVKYGGNQYIAKTNHQSNILTPPPVDTTNYDLFSEGFNFLSQWTVSTDYKIGDVVTLSGYNYVAIQDSPSTALIVTSSSALTNTFTAIDTTGIEAGMYINFSGTVFGDVGTESTYYVKQVVSGTEFTICDTPDGPINALETGTGSMIATVAPHPTDTDYWQILSKGINWKNEWKDDTEYEPGDAVRFGSNAYICVRKHRSEQDDGSTVTELGGGAANSRPDIDSTGVYWNLLIVGSEVDILSTKGDLVYYSDVGPTRLPIGEEGQILIAGEQGIPEWSYLGHIEYTYYVAPEGQDLPAPTWGKSFDKPFKTVRYAAEQVEQGPRNPGAKHLLELNRVFIQREVSKWIEYQITSNISPFSNVTVTSISTNNTLTTASAHGLTAGRRLTAKTTANGIVAETNYYVVASGLTTTQFRVSLSPDGSAISTLVDGTGLSINMLFDFDEYKCERDVGFIVDALIFDIGHGGNVKTRGAANSYVGGLTPEETYAYGVGLGNEDSESIAALNYMVQLVDDILQQQPPSTNYQELTGDNSTAIVNQYFNPTVEAESGAIDEIRSLVTIVTNAIADGNPDNVPERNSPGNLIRVSTGTFKEVLPIIVPEKTCIQGDELRSTNVGPAAVGDRTLDVSDAKYSLGALSRMETIVGEIVLGTDVTETSGNNVVQSSEWPYASSVVEIDATRLIRTIGKNIDFRLNSNFLADYTLPTGYNSSFLSGYGDARTLIKENRDFIKAEIVAFINANYPGVQYSRTICKRDVGYIIDALIYDLTYGGKSQILNAALAYYDGPGSSLQIDSTELLATIGAYTRLQTIIQQISTNTLVDRTTGNSSTQWTDSTNLTNGSSANTFLNDSIQILIDVLDGGSTDSAPTVNITSINSNVATTGMNHGLQVGDAIIPKVSSNGLIKNTKYWILTVPAANQFTVSISFGGSTHTLTNDTGLAIEAFKIDKPFALNGFTSTTALITAAQTLDAAQETIIENVIDDLNISAYHTDFVVSNTGLTNDDFVVYVGKSTVTFTYVSGGTVTKADESTVSISNFVYDESTGYATITTSSDHGLEAGDIINVAGIIVSYVDTERSPINQTTLYPAVDSRFPITNSSYTKVLYIQNKCIRDIRLILEAVMFDFMFDSNVQTRNAGYAYLRASAREVYTLDQKTITRNALENAKTEALTNVGGDTTAQARITTLMTELDDIIFSGSTEGSRCATDQRMVDYGILQIERNRDFIKSEIDAWVDTAYQDVVTSTDAATDILTCSDTSWMERNTAIRFSGNVLLSGLSSTVTYYVQNVVSSTEFKIATSRNSNTALDIDSSDSGSMIVKLHYNSDLCMRDVDTYIDAIKYDLKYPGNYKSLLSARYYANAALGSLEEDMFYLRDATGLRDMTMEGLTGDLLAPNEYGTSRVSAGAYASLDPGWGPEDYRVWIQTRSPYVQGLTTFGTAAIGQKIDGALHAGGNDSIVSNDFTQVISDGIGAWVANNGRAELVSVFTYYAHIGYLSTEGGRIRGTNGNNSYGDFGSVAEGVDPREIPGTAVVDNRFQFKATVDSGFGDGDQFFQLEFGNAGIDYSDVEWTYTGGGTQAQSENYEFRDDGVFQVRLLDFNDDSSGQFGGFGYLSNSNTAQGGTSTSLTLAATDGEINNAYVGMVVYITGGSGVGQYGIITSYNAGTKIAAVRKENGTAGWEHIVNGTTIATPDASTTYVVEPRISFSSPSFYNSNGSLPASGDWADVVYGDTFQSFIDITGNYVGTNGEGAIFTITKNGYKYIVSIQNGGTGYQRLETINILGSNIGGLDGENDLLLTITSIDTSTGEIIEFDQDGFGLAGKFVAIQPGSQQGAISTNGTSWTDVPTMMPSTANWNAITHGVFDDGSTIFKTSRFVAVVTGGNVGAYSADGTTWIANTLPESASWSSVAFGNGRFVAIASDTTTVAVSLDGEIWDVTGTLPTTGFVSITYGGGKFVAVKPGQGGAVAFSSNGVSWTADDLPANSTWSGVAFGNNIFVAVASDSNNGAYSVDGETWVASTIGSVDGSSVSGFQRVKYGQGLFMATTYQASVQDYSFVATSENGIDWMTKGVDLGSTEANNFSGWKALAFGSPQRTGKWALLPYDTSDVTAWVRTGATAKARAFVAEQKIFAIRMTEPGSGYDEVPTMTITDPNNIYEAPFTVRVGKGVLGQPSWVNRGTGYQTISAEVASGDGYADFFQQGGFVAVRRMTFAPTPGSNVVFEGLPGRNFKLVNVLTFLGQNDGSYTSFYQVSPEITSQEATQLTHLGAVTTRLRYSQVRLTGHDFLDIGTGSFIETNYPNQPLQDPFQPNETVENNGGRVFFTSTDQDGNFRVGDLFSVEQSTGIATLNADAFNISGLQELSLGTVTLGGGSATVTEFSTDPFFTADSDSVIPTQRAIKAFIANQIGGGGAALNVNSITAGSIKISSNIIENITGQPIKVGAVLEFRGGVTGVPIAFNYFLA